MRWTICHIRELMPTKQESRGLGPSSPMAYALDDDIDSVTFIPLGSEQPMTESMTGILAESLVVEGTLDDTARVSSIVPEPKASAFGTATVRQVMDITTALDYSEDYSDPHADYWTVHWDLTHLMKDAFDAASIPIPHPQQDVQFKRHET